MKITKSQLTKIIREELTLIKEDDTPFGERSYDHSLVSNVSKTIEWDIGQAFTFVLDLLEDVNASDEYREVRKVLEKAAQSSLYQASQEEPVNEDDEAWQRSGEDYDTDNPTTWSDADWATKANEIGLAQGVAPDVRALKFNTIVAYDAGEDWEAALYSQVAR